MNPEDYRRQQEEEYMRQQRGYGGPPGMMPTTPQVNENEKVIEKVRDHPVVLVPCHRSHFDYLIITYLCHLYFVSPPHIFAGINMAFWPMAPLLRASGAFFVRRSFADNPLYKLVFRQYLMFLIREGYTQEFFIEGGRSRTGKIMTPKLGMLAAIVGRVAFGQLADWIGAIPAYLAASAWQTAMAARIGRVSSLRMRPSRSTPSCPSLE